MMEEMIAKRDRRRRLGIYYTPPHLVEPILDAALDPLLAEMRDEQSCAARLGDLRIIDPACGSGHFLLAAWRRLAERVCSLVSPPRQRPLLRLAAASLHGIDVDPQAWCAGEERLRREAALRGLTPRDFVNWFTLGEALLGVSLPDASFDLVIGNPPFVDAESMCATDRPRRLLLASQFETARGNWDLASLFVERSLRLVRPGGRVGLVLPRRLLASDHAQHVQRLMLDQTIEAIHENRAGDFADAQVETITLVLRRTPAQPRHAVRLRDDSSRERRVGQGTLGLLPPGHWSAALAGDAQARRAARAMRRDGRRLLDAARVGDGATTAEAYTIREAVVEADQCAGPAVRLVNTGVIDPWALQWGRRPTRYLRSAWQSPVVPLEWLEERLPRRSAQARSAKVLIAGLAGRIEAVVDEGGSLCGKSAVQVIPHDPDLCHALCAWLNSAPINAVYRALFGARGFGARSMHLGPRQIEQLPLWGGDGASEARIIRRLGDLSRTLHRLHSAPAETRRERARAIEQRLDAIVEALLDKKETMILSAAIRGAPPAPDRVP